MSNYTLTILSQLESLGLSNKEAAAYLALLNLKKGTAQSVAKNSGLKRPTTYLVLQSLIEKKLVAVTKYRNVRDYRALPLEHLRHYVKEQKRSALRVLPEMQKMYNERQFKTRLRVYNNLDDLKILLEKSLREKSVLKVLGDEQYFNDNLGLYWDYFLKRSGQHNARPQFKKTAAGVFLLLWSDKVAFFRPNGQIQVLGFKNAGLSKMYQSLWNRY